MGKIKFTIHKDGRVEADASGFSGTSCLRESEKLLRALGRQVRQTLKEEYFLPEENMKEIAKN